MKWAQALILVGVGVATTTAGVCPSYPLIRDFDFSKYTGLWYQQDKQQSGWAVPGRCWQSLYVKDATTGNYKMRLRYHSTFTGRPGVYESTLTLLGPSQPSVIQYSIPYTFMEDTFQVLATDYSTYSIEYQCDENGLLPKIENVFLLTRAKTPGAAVLQKAYAIMHRYGLDIRKLERVDQTCGGLKLRGVLKPNEIITGQLWEDLVQKSANDLDYNGIDDGEESDGQMTRSASIDVLSRADAPNSYHSDGHGPVVGGPDTYHPDALGTVVGGPPRLGAIQRGQRRRHRPVNPTERIALGQSLVTRLWHVLHTPLR